MYLPAVSLGRMIFTTCGSESGVSGASPPTQVTEGGPRTPTLDEGRAPRGLGVTCSLPSSPGSRGGIPRICPAERAGGGASHLPALYPEVAGHGIARLDPGQLVLSEFTGKLAQEKAMTDWGRGAGTEELRDAEEPD